MSLSGPTGALNRTELLFRLLNKSVLFLLWLIQIFVVKRVHSYPKRKSRGADRICRAGQTLQDPLRRMLSWRAQREGPIGWITRETCRTRPAVHSVLRTDQTWKTRLQWTEISLFFLKTAPWQQCLLPHSIKHSWVKLLHILTCQTLIINHCIVMQ